MEFRQVLTILRDLFMPQPRNTCPHCGGIRCIGACQFNEKQPVAADVSATGQPELVPELVAEPTPQPAPEPTPEVRDEVSAVERLEFAADEQTNNCAPGQTIMMSTVQKQK